MENENVAENSARKSVIRSKVTLNVEQLNYVPRRRMAIKKSLISWFLITAHTYTHPHTELLII